MATLEGALSRDARWRILVAIALPLIGLMGAAEIASGEAPAKEPNRRELASASSNPALPPYLLELDRNHATIAWRTLTAQRGRLTLRSYAGEVVLDEPGAASRFHRIQAEGLQPGTRYRYEIGGSYRGEFTTASADALFDVAIFGHSAGTPVPGEYPRGHLAQSLIGLDPDFAIATGDITYHASVPEFSRHFLRPFERFLRSKPIYVCAANHESAWPWVHGASYDTFRRVFPYRYPPEAAHSEPAGAHYSVVYKHVKLVFLPFTHNRDAFDRQLAWAEAELDESRSEFNLVLIGGRYNEGDGGDVLFERLGRHRVDLALAGDGSGAFQQKRNGVPFFFAGDGGADHHPFYYLEFERYRFSVKLLTTGGDYEKFFTQFYSKRKKRPVQDLAKSMRRLDSGALLFSDIGRASTDFNGLRLEFPWTGPKGAVLELCWSPGSSTASDRALSSTGGCESIKGYREKWLLLEPSGSKRFTIELPRLDPLTQRPYVLGSIRLRVLDAEYRPSLEMPDVDSAKLFRDAPEAN